MACGCTSTDGIGVTQDGALLDRTERAEHHPHVVLRDLLGQHTHKQFAFCHQKRALVDEYVNEDFSIFKFYRLTVAVFTVGRFHLNGVMHLEKKMKNLIFFRIKQSTVAINVKVQRQRGAQKRNRKRNYFGRRPSIKRRCQTAGKSGKNPLMHYYCRWMLRPHVSFFFLFTTLHYDLDVSNPTNNFVEVRLFIFFN